MLANVLLEMWTDSPDCKVQYLLCWAENLYILTQVTSMRGSPAHIEVTVHTTFHGALYQLADYNPSPLPTSLADWTDI